jgi:hypothetical protein
MAVEPFELECSSLYRSVHEVHIERLQLTMYEPRNCNSKFHLSLKKVGMNKEIL